MIERLFPPCYADAPFVARVQPRELPFGTRRNEIVALEHGKIEKFACHFYADSVQADVAGTRLTEAVTIKARQWIATAALQLRPENIGRHGGNTISAISESCMANLRVDLPEWTLAWRRIGCCRLNPVANFFTI